MRNYERGQFLSRRHFISYEQAGLTSSYAQSMGYMSFNKTPEKSLGTLAVTSFMVLTTAFNPLTIFYKSE
jgi:hypothetical protein